MELIFGLIFWFIVALFLSGLAVVGGIISAIIFKAVTKKKVRYWAWAISPPFCIMSFFVLIIFEAFLYATITNTDTGMGDYAKVYVNDDYYLNWTDVPDWTFVGKNVDGGDHAKEILVYDNKIVVSSGDKFEDASTYRLYEVDTDKKVWNHLYSAPTTSALWNKYTKEHGIDKERVQTCDDFYKNSRKPFAIGALIFNILLLAIFFTLIGKRLFIKK
jgi:hypothetical protein